MNIFFNYSMFLLNQGSKKMNLSLSQQAKSCTSGYLALNLARQLTMDFRINYVVYHNDSFGE